MGRKASRKNQKMYRMKGCSKRTRKNYLGGSADANLAYTGHNIQTVPNPFLAYTGKGGACSSNLSPSLAIPLNSNALNKIIPTRTIKEWNTDNKENSKEEADEAEAAEQRPVKMASKSSSR